MPRESLAARITGRRIFYEFTAIFDSLTRSEAARLSFWRPRLRFGFASELNTDLPISHDVAALRAVKISGAFQNAPLEMSLILFVVIYRRRNILFGSVTLAATPLSQASRRAREMMHWREVSCARRYNFAKSAAIFQKHGEARFSMSVTSGLSVRGDVENINARGGRSDCSCAQVPPCRSASA